MSTRPRLLVLCLLGVVSAISGCVGQATPPPPAQAPLAVASASLHCKTLDYSKDQAANELNGIDKRGEIAGDGAPAGGYVIFPPYSQTDYRGVNFPGAVETHVAGSGVDKTIAGFYRDRSGDRLGFIENHGVWTLVDGPSDAVELLGLNDDGLIVGFFARHGLDHAFELLPRLRRIKLKPPGATSAAATGINDLGHVVGYMWTEGGSVESFLLEDGSYTELAYPGAGRTTAFGVNGRDVIVGSYVDAAGATHGFLLTDPRTNPNWQSFDAPGADDFTQLSGINNRSELVGSYRDASRVMHGFLCR
jgi:probable HAF family extracellular repeat protein